MKEKAGVMKPPKTPNTKPSIYNHVNERCRKKGERSKQGNTNNKAMQNNTHVCNRQEKTLQECCIYNAMIIRMLHIQRLSIYNHVNERCRKKGERSKQGNTNNKAMQNNTHVCNRQEKTLQECCIYNHIIIRMLHIQRLSIYNHVNERCRKKGERSKQGNTNNKAMQNNTHVCNRQEKTLQECCNVFVLVVPSRPKPLSPSSLLLVSMMRCSHSVGVSSVCCTKS